MISGDLPDDNNKELVPLRIEIKRKPTRKTLQRVTEQALVDASSRVLVEFWDTVNEGLQKRDKDTMKLVAEMMKYTSRGGGITNNIFNQQVANNVPKERGFEKIVRVLQTQRDERGRQEAIEAEFEDAPN